MRKPGTFAVLDVATLEFAVRRDKDGGHAADRCLAGMADATRRATTCRQPKSSCHGTFRISAASGQWH